LPTNANLAQPFCPHFGPCGGCQLQNLTYAAQLSGKAAKLQALLDATGLALPELRLHASPPLAYRNRIRLTLAVADGQLRAGYIRQAQPSVEAVIPTGAAGGVEGPPHFAPPAIKTSFLPITQCPIAAPILWRATEAFLALINQHRATWLGNPQLTPDQLELFATSEDAPAESRLQLSLYLRTGLKNIPKQLTADFTSLCNSLRERIPELTGAGIFLLPTLSAQRSRRNEQPRPGPTWGSPGLMYSISGTTYWIPRGAFFQVNRFLLPELLALTTASRTGQLERFHSKSMRSDRRSHGFLSKKTTLHTISSDESHCETALAWDLYAGVGLFSRALAAHFAQVIAVEIAEPAVTALASTKLTNLRAVKATTLDFLRAAVIERDRPDLIVLDPPRSGAGREVCELLGRVAAPTLVYVSCSPEILPTDLTTLSVAGYSVAELHLVDLFPQTSHIETVAILTRAKSSVRIQ
jgi:23S rRNA (uracil1939-C5)-methyltransferase